MNKNEKRQRLEEARNILKKEFIGIDQIIDQLIQSVTPWYITPEILDRPLVISLWGITGTGKTSIVKRLFEILEITKVVLFDSGELIDKTTLGEMVVETLSLDDSYTTAGCSDTVFVFDEFQHARTIDERGFEITKSSIRQMWNLIDSGTLIVREFNYNAMKLTVFLEDLGELVHNFPGIPIEGLEIKDPECVKTVLSSMGLNWYEERARAIYSTKLEGDRPHLDYVEEEGEEEDKVEETDTSTKIKDPFRPISAIPSAVLRSYFTFCNRIDKSIPVKDRYDTLMKCKTLDEVFEYISQFRGALSGQKKFDFSKSIIFLIGNLDEAFYGADNVDPDLNADMFKRSIDKVTISSIKVALGKRFRAEQIARFGNTMLKYPAFTSQNYHDLIRLELDKLLKRFEEHTGKIITYTPDIIELIYSEGVFPAQGCRPVFTTITNMFTPLLSSALVDFSDEEIEIKASIVEPEKGYRVDSKDIMFMSEQGTIKIHTLPLTLGTCRNPKNNPLRYAIGVHEAGHAVVTSFCTGDIPLEIVSTSAMGGGHTSFSRYGDSYNKCTKKVLKADIMSSLGGIIAETVIFKKFNSDTDSDEYLTLGAESDLRNAFDSFCDAVYKKGYYKPLRFAKDIVTNRNEGLPSGFLTDVVDNNMRSDFESFVQEVKKIIMINKKLIAMIGKRAAEFGSVSGKEFYELVEALADEDRNSPYKLTPDKMKSAREEISFDYYEHMVLKETEG